VTIDTLRASLADRYRIERELGAGGMATVYLAQDIRHERQVAIKVLRPELAAVIGADRFLSEIKTTANLQHPHILSLFDSGTVDGTVFYVMPFVDGESLRDRLTREKQLPIAEALRIATEVADALQYAHQHGIIHRDIKPENILLHGGHALVADFGIALAASKTGGARMTETGMSLGTPQYMSPEQAMGERELDARTDVYALGCTTYEMLTGEPPFTGPTAQAIVAKVMTAEPVEASTLRKSIPPHVDDAVHIALQKLPADRFATAAAFAEALRTGTTEQRGGVQRAARPVAGRPSRLWSLAGAGAMAVVAAFFIGRRTASTAGDLSTEWHGELLGGPQVATQPTVSHDAQLVAFNAMVDGETQPAVLKPASGDWRVLATDRSRGLVGTTSWSPDDSKIYYDRILDVPNGVYSVSPLGSEERLVLPNAAFPGALPDGSLLVERVNADRNLQLYRFWPESGRIDTLNAIGDNNLQISLYHAFPDGKEAAFFGRPATQKDSANHLYAIDLNSKRVRRLAPDSTFSLYSLATTPDNQWVVIGTHDGPLQRIVAVARDGSDRTRTLATLTSLSYQVDVGSDNALYFDQYDRPRQLIRYSPSDHHTDALMIPDGTFSATNNLPLPDGRTLLGVTAGTGSRVMVLAPGKDATPFMDTGEATDGPFALLGHDEVLLMLGAGPARTVAIVSIATGQLIRRIPGVNAFSIAGSPDGTTVYYATANTVWAVASTGGPPHKIRVGDAVAIDPGGRYLVIEADEASHVRLYHVPLDGSAEHEIEVHSDLRLASGVYLTSNAVAADGRIVVQVTPTSSWFWPAAILDPSTGKLDVLPPGAGYDMKGGWSPDGHIVYDARSFRSALWRFRPVGATGEKK
jgi:Tol biopolymer transport system component